MNQELRRTVWLLAFVGVLVACPLLAQQTAPDFAAARDETVRNLSALVQIDTSNPPGNEIKAAQHLKAIFDREGIPSEIFESAPGRANIVARLKGNGKKRPVLLMAHLDVVGVERSKWTADPFGGATEDGYLYGRGSVDDKGMVAADLEVFLLLHRLKVPLDRDVIFLSEAGEEGTSQFGIEYMVANHWDKIDSEFALNEGGELLLKDGKVVYVAIATSEKVPRGYRLVAHGTSGHGSMPRLDDPVTHIGGAVWKIGTWEAPMRLNETTREFFRKIAEISPPDQAYMYTHLDDPAVQQKLRHSNILYNSMLRTSISPTIIKGGFRSNVIPADAEANLDIRALPDEDMPAFVATMKKVIDDPLVDVEPVAENARPAPPPSGLHTEMFQALEAAQQKAFPGAFSLPMMPAWATDSAQLRAKGVQAYGIMPPISEIERARVHGNDERVSVEGLGKFVEFLYTAVTGVAASK